MSIFLYGRALSKKVDELLSENCTCIVSYIGKGVKDKIKKINKQKKINFICNFHSNGTNPFEVEKLRNYLGKEKVKQMDSFHAKVYYSESGAVICSANLSTNGLELFNEPANQLEAGIFVKNDESAYKEVLKWHKSLKVEEIDPHEIEKRIKSYQKIRQRIKGKPSTANRTELTVDDFLHKKNGYNQNVFALFFCFEQSSIDEKTDIVIDASTGIDETIKNYRKDQNLDDWTEEYEYNEYPKDLKPTIKIIKNKLLLYISAKLDKDDLPKSKSLKFEDQLYKYNHYRTVYVKEDEADSLVFFYNFSKEYKITAFFKKELKKMLQESLNDKRKRENWKKWINSPEGQGWFMSIDTLKKLI